MKVLEAKSNWLFLDNDSNESVNQFIGTRLVTNENLTAWFSHFEYLAGIDRYLAAPSIFLVAPSKESVFPEVYPFRRAAVTPIDQLQEMGKSPKAIIYPVPLLRAHESHTFTTYDRGESHWNSFGALLVAQHMLSRVGVPLPSALDLGNIRWEIRKCHGDLDNKIPGREPDERLFGTMLKQRSALKYDNKIHNTGRIWIFENPGVRNRAVLFGDSFSVPIARYLAEAFGRLAYIHSTSIDNSILQIERPDFLFQEISERFIISAPRNPRTFSLRSGISGKLRSDAGPKTQDILSKHALDKNSNIEPFYVSLIG